jgi:hypothetical protein
MVLEPCRDPRPTWESPATGPRPMTHHWAELATRWQRLAERQREHLVFLRQRYRRYDAARLDVLISGAERNLAGWAALAAASKRGDEVRGGSEQRPCGEPAPPKLDSRYPPARLAADPPAAVAALERGADGQPPHRWPAFLHTQPQPNSPSFHTECLKDFSDAVREAQALNSDAEPFRDPSRITESDDDAFLWASGLAHDQHGAGQDSHSSIRKRLLRQIVARLSR